MNPLISEIKHWPCTQSHLEGKGLIPDFFHSVATRSQSMTCRASAKLGWSASTGHHRGFGCPLDSSCTSQSAFLCGWLFPALPSWLGQLDFAPAHWGNDQPGSFSEPYGSWTLVQEDSRSCQQSFTDFPLYNTCSKKLRTAQPGPNNLLLSTQHPCEEG